jgi:hypothetical protein
MRNISELCRLSFIVNALNSAQTEEELSTTDAHDQHAAHPLRVIVNLKKEHP